MRLIFYINFNRSPQNPFQQTMTYGTHLPCPLLFFAQRGLAWVTEGNTGEHIHPLPLVSLVAPVAGTRMPRSARIASRSSRQEERPGQDHREAERSNAAEFGTYREATRRLGGYAAEVSWSPRGHWDPPGGHVVGASKSLGRRELHGRR